MPDAGMLRTRGEPHCPSCIAANIPAYAPCDTGYHDLQHIMDVTLASARLMDGYERSAKSRRRALGEELFVFGILLALFHDSGYLRKRGSEETGKVRNSPWFMSHAVRNWLKNYHAGCQAWMQTGRDATQSRAFHRL